MLEVQLSQPKRSKEVVEDCRVPEQQQASYPEDGVVAYSDDNKVELL